MAALGIRSAGIRPRVHRRYRAAVPVYLVRHAHAGSRAAWSGDDDQRPLSPKGDRQTGALVRQPSELGVGCVVSSPSLRCVQTVQPLARALGIEVDTREELYEGADADDALALMMKLAPHDPAVCTHGDLIPKMIRRLIGEGMKTKDANVSQKGSMWVIEVDDGRPVKGKYYPPA
jgi:8-oxo-dGTP diphosphatase